MRARQVAVVGAGWAGLAAAVQATQDGHAVTVFEMAAQPGGRARGVAVDGLQLDNGQHILIGAYTETLALMRTVGADPDALLLRRPLAIRYPDGSGLALPPGPPMLAFARGVLGAAGWRWSERLALLRAATGWLATGFRADASTTVAQLCAGLPARLREDLLAPLCVAALNTPAEAASAQVFLRVLHDALFAGRGSADLLLPRASLSALLPEPAWSWLAARGATLRSGARAGELVRDGDRWRLDGAPFDAVILAASARESARLAEPHVPAWAAQAAAFGYEPIITVYLRASASLPLPMIALREGPQAPAQFAFDLGALGLAPGVFAFVVSGARAWVARGLPATAEAVQAQAQAAFGAAFSRAEVLHTAAEKRATFACVPGLARPAAAIAPGLWAAGDYTEGPYPATLEGAVRSGRRAARGLVNARA